MDIVEEIMSTEESESYSSEELVSESESELDVPEDEGEVRVASSSCISVSESFTEELDPPFCSSKTPRPRSYKFVSANKARGFRTCTMRM